MSGPEVHQSRAMIRVLTGATLDAAAIGGLGIVHRRQM